METYNNNMFNNNNSFANPNEPQSNGKFDFEDIKFIIRRKYQNFIDKTTIYPRERWASLIVTLLIFFSRVFYVQGM